jgi:hypothetical protein
VELPGLQFSDDLINFGREFAKVKRGPSERALVRKFVNELQQCKYFLKAHNLPVPPNL